jgi:CBS-domain-containing membrane protein
MIDHRVKSLPVIDQRRNLVGIIAREDVMRAMERWTLRQEPPVLPFATARCLPTALTDIRAKKLALSGLPA